MHYGTNFAFVIISKMHGRTMIFYTHAHTHIHTYKILTISESLGTIIYINTIISIMSRALWD